jgi:POT family proton-dependent oligopeptide transporter
MSVYGALIYMSSIPGAWVADRLFGTRGATLIGAVQLKTCKLMRHKLT